MKFMQALSDVQGQAAWRLRISRLRNSGNLKAPAQAVLKSLGELKRAYLTEFEEKMLCFIK